MGSDFVSMIGKVTMNYRMLEYMLRQAVYCSCPPEYGGQSCKIGETIKVGDDVLVDPMTNDKGLRGLIKDYNKAVDAKNRSDLRIEDKQIDPLVDRRDAWAHGRLVFICGEQVLVKFEQHDKNATMTKVQIVERISVSSLMAVVDELCVLNKTIETAWRDAFGGTPPQPIKFC
jgi:hypothetical protein